jgi:hypothetical protein
MLRIATLLLLTFITASPAVAQSEPVRPAATSDVGPWEAVVWTRGKTVVRCTLSRAKPTADGFSYGFLADREGVLLGVAHASWKFRSEAPVPATLKPASGGERKLTARPASPSRANLELPSAALDDLQKSEHIDLQIETNRARLPFDDFNAARVVLESCLQNLGKNHEAGR